MHDIFVWIEVESYDAWLAVHRELAPHRREHGIEDGPIYRGIDEPQTALFHARAKDLDRAWEWFRSDTLKAASPRATVTARTYHVGRLYDPAAGS
jgi:hypothetical protein